MQLPRSYSEFFCVAVLTFAYMICPCSTSSPCGTINTGPTWLSSDEVERIIIQLKVDEGYITKIYQDSLGKSTFGIGHLIKETDPENKLKEGTEVSKERIDSVFMQDLNDAASLTKVIFPKCNTWPSEVKEIIVNMAFNLGGKLRQFEKLAQALEKRDWNKVADEMVNSEWYDQVKDRSERLVTRMRAVKDK